MRPNTRALVEFRLVHDGKRQLLGVEAISIHAHVWVALFPKESRIEIRKQKKEHSWRGNLFPEVIPKLFAKSSGD